VARPTGVGHAITTIRIPIEYREEWEEAARIGLEEAGLEE